MGEGIFSLSFVEISIIVFLAFLLLKPNEYKKLSIWIGKMLNQMVRSYEWKAIQQTSRELRNLPTNMMREANMDLAEAEKDIRKAMEIHSAMSQSQPPPSATESPIQPPIIKSSPETDTSHDS